MPIHKLYRRGYRLYNRLYGNFRIKDGKNPAIVPLEGCQDLRAVGAQLLEGWVSA